jgi:hypothetical protein
MGVVLLSALLVWYTMSGVYLTALLVTTRHPDLNWRTFAAGSALVAITGGLTSLGVWRLSPTAPRWLLVFGLCGAGFCILLPTAWRGGNDGSLRDLWLTASIAAVGFFALFAVAAHYVRRHIGPRP